MISIAGDNTTSPDPILAHAAAPSRRRLHVESQHEIHETRRQDVDMTRAEQQTNIRSQRRHWRSAVRHNLACDKERRNGDNTREQVRFSHPYAAVNRIASPFVKTTVCS